MAQELHYCRSTFTIRSLAEWASLEEGIKCACRIPFLVEHGIESNAMLRSVKFWYNKYALAGHAVIQIVFQYKDTYISAFFEGFKDPKKFGLVYCRQFYGNHSDVGASYITQRAANYQIILKWDVIGNSKTYKDAFEGPIKEINRVYVHYPFENSWMFDGVIVLNHDCLWYACNLFAKLVGIEVNELIANPNVSKPIKHSLEERRDPETE